LTAGGGNGHDDPEDDSGIESSGLAPVDGEVVAAPSPGEIQALRRERDDLKDQLLRRRADFDNYRKRVERDRQAAGLEAEANLLRDLVPSIDNLERALRAASPEDPLREGVELIRRELAALLDARGVVAEDPTGQRFDPESHQALSHEPAAGVPDGTVLETLLKGYRFRDRLLRPALVKVARGRDADGTEALH
jgi:molecular chaperone GrpE